MKRFFQSMILVLALIFTILPAQSQALSLSESSKTSLEQFLSQMTLYQSDYSYVTSDSRTRMMKAILSVGPCVNYNIYPGEQVSTNWDTKDPQKKWDSHVKVSTSKIHWILKNVFHFTDADIKAAQSKLDPKYCYLQDGYYYYVVGGIGWSRYVTDPEIETYGDYYKVSFDIRDDLDDSYRETMFAVMKPVAIDGKEYWTLYYYSSEAPSVTGFLDISDSKYYAKPVQWAADRDITKGVAVDAFGPNDSCTRAQVVTFLWKALGSPEPSSAKNPFTDVKSSAYYYKPVLWAVEKGITSGTSSTTFSPSATVTRGQTMTFLWNALGRPKAVSSSSFKDVPSGKYYYEPVQWAVSKGVTSGTGEGKFSPNAPCTRAQIVTFLYKALGDEDSKWLGTYTTNSGETITVTGETNTGLLITKKTQTAAGDWIDIQATLTFENPEKTIASEPWQNGTDKVTYTLKDDRITVSWPEGWWDDRDYLRK